ncbi:hypothetical protein PR003_g26194 [Phytophthora rubi]|uniref:Uncharacterized protein n=1 Tax=Phytophthora rubi TaxID=129364 RepID=A0A6A3L512_9STRA|nr:hypothetical protein PR001_g25351 [Phytophthora rubi]KAE9014711.1 hypothetical protein PR002_g14140 [Phytophthora rubi]KAE9286887.1 hypothetical protein PR003_g26194 [Phytophthora rubi]
MRAEEEDTSVDSQLGRGAIADSAAGAAKGAATGAVAGVGVWGLVGPAVHMLGFMSGGIASGSAAASMMSTAALANAGSVASGSTVAVLQSVGALGIATPTGIGIAAVGAVVGAAAPPHHVVLLPIRCPSVDHYNSIAFRHQGNPRSGK